jgi:hypothetical protein
MTATTSVQFELSVTGMPDSVRASVAEHGERWVASVRCRSASTTGVGATAREALVAALAPFGARTSTAVMAAPEMFAASALVLAAQAAG